MYYKQLDFLRFIAISLVIIAHWFNNSISIFFVTGELGVFLFFTLSGFLITRLLLLKKNKIDENTESKKFALKNFYIRRVLRLFPIYYLILCFLLIINFAGFKEKSTWYFFYASNIYTYIQQRWDGVLGPYWSLAVEEQFYLIWPFFLFFINKNNVRKIFYACILLGPIFRGIFLLISVNFFETHNKYLSSFVLMPNCIDAFAFGGVLAFNLLNNSKDGSALVRFMHHRYTIIGITICTFLLLFFKGHFFYYIFFPTFFSFCAMHIVCVLIKGVTGFGKTIIEFPFFIFLGKISYGLYIYHGLMFTIMAWGDVLFAKLRIPFKANYFLNNENEIVKGVSMVAFLIMIAACSFYFIEKPIMKLKRRYS